MKCCRAARSWGDVKAGKITVRLARAFAARFDFRIETSRRGNGNVESQGEADAAA
jgi:hypothetical protein